MNHKYIVLLFLLFNVSKSLTQNTNSSLVPNELPDVFFGVWLNDSDELTLVTTEEYLIFNNRLWYYNEILGSKIKIGEFDDVFQIRCVTDNDFNTITIYLVNNNSIYFETSSATPSIYLNRDHKNYKYSSVPSLIKAKWYGQEKVINIADNEFFVNNKPFVFDFFTRSRNNSILVGYNEGNYSLFRIKETQENSFLYYEGEIFIKETFFQKYSTLILVFILGLFAVVLYFIFKWKVNTNRRKETLKRKLAETQLKSIRSQMNPHFVFNALSAIQNLINKNDNEKANHYLTRFSQLMRLTLDKSEKGLVPLSDEIESIQQYLELENLRFTFEYDLKVSKEIDPDEVEIPAMLIQPFVENAIIHGLNESRIDKKLTILFGKSGLYLSCLVEDNGIGINASKSKKQIEVKKMRYGHKLAEDRIALINESLQTNAKIAITDLSDSSEHKTGTRVEILTPFNY